MVKRKKRLMCVALTAIGVLGLSGCNEVTAKDNGDIITYKYKDNEYSITTNDIVEKYLREDKNSHASALYDALYEVIVRANFEEGGLLYSFKSKVEAAAEEATEKAKETADENKQKWEDYLNAQGYDDEDMTLADKEKEFYLKNIYSEMTSTVDDQFFQTFKGYKDGLISDTNELQKKYNLLNGSEGWIQKYVPYHVKHILVQNDASQDYGYSRGQISSDNAHNLFEVVENLANGSSFSDVANRFSQDPGNGDGGNKKGGEYIMATDAGFVNEFQLGIYAWDLILSKNSDKYLEGATADDQKLFDAKKDNLFINEDAEQTIKDYGVSFIPYGVVAELNDVREQTTKGLLTINDGDADYYPRNILFNKYFQNRNVGFITNEKALTVSDLLGGENTSYVALDVEEGKSAPTSAAFEAKYGENAAGFSYSRIDNISGNIIYSDIDDNGAYKTSGKEYFTEAENPDQYSHFEKISIGGVEKEVLCDTDHNPILVVRNKESSSGIHFIIIERSGFDDKDVFFRANETEGTTEEYKAKLNEYYAPVNPKNRDGIDATTNKPYWEADFPSVKVGEVNYPKKTYVQKETIGDKSFVNNTVNNYQERVDTLSTNIKKQVNSYNKYYWLNSTLQLTLKDIKLYDEAEAIKLQEMVDKYISKEKVNTENTNAKDFDEKWISYATSLDKQANEREYCLLPEILAADFGNPDLYKAGQPGYNSKYHTVKGSN